MMNAEEILADLIRAVEECRAILASPSVVSVAPGLDEATEMVMAIATADAALERAQEWLEKTEEGA